MAAIAAHLGLKAVLVQEAWVDWPDLLNDWVGNIQLSRIMSADVRIDPHGFDIAGFAALEEVGARRRCILGIDASEDSRQVGWIARNTAGLIEIGRDLRDNEVTILEGRAGDRYGIPVQSTIDAIQFFGRGQPALNAYSGVVH